LQRITLLAPIITFSTFQLCWISTKRGLALYVQRNDKITKKDYQQQPNQKTWGKRSREKPSNRWI